MTLGFYFETKRGVKITFDSGSIVNFLVDFAIKEAKDEKLDMVILPNGKGFNNAMKKTDEEAIRGLKKIVLIFARYCDWNGLQRKFRHLRKEYRLQ